MTVIPLTLVISALVGWSDITVQPNRASRAHGYYAASVAALDRPSERTEDTLVRYDLKAMFRSDPEAALLRLEKLARQQPDADLVFALAELSWVEGRRLDRWRRAGAIDRFIDTVAYAFFDGDGEAELIREAQAKDARAHRSDCTASSLERLRAVGSNGYAVDRSKRIPGFAEEKDEFMPPKPWLKRLVYGLVAGLLAWAL